MMASINLLPWRERLREERKREFLVMLGGIVVIAAGLVFLVDRYFRGELDDQQTRNSLISEEIAVMDSRLTEISQLRDQRADILDRMEVIRDLQGSRPLIVYVFDEMVRTLPSAVYFNNVQRQGDVLSIEGVAESNNQVSELMRRLDESEWFQEPGLEQISATTATWTDRGSANAFSLTLQLESMTQSDNEQTAESD
ncbi:MAG: PilN domain-containing protein [Pseudohongiellaceae bacterium]